MVLEGSEEAHTYANYEVDCVVYGNGVRVRYLIFVDRNIQLCVHIQYLKYNDDKIVNLCNFRCNRLFMKIYLELFLLVLQISCNRNIHKPKEWCF